MHAYGLERFRMELTAVALEAISVETVAMRCPPITGELDGTGVVRVGHLRAGRFTVTTGRHTLAGAPVFLFPSRPYTGWWEELGLTTLTVPVGVVEDHARALLDDHTFRLHFTGHHPDGDHHYWTGTVEHLLRDVLSNETATASSLIRAQVLRMVLTALLHTFPSTFTGHPPSPRSRPVRWMGRCAGQWPSSTPTGASPSGWPRSPPPPG
jgi:hypothetical protein